ncbi:hypothetical protein [Paraburkholderia youngii]|uniref:hypothetical protein n=1 Tax=Paraburkholderia youngii TaxID=2782701 RepID=UPI003D233980
MQDETISEMVFLDFQNIGPKAGPVFMSWRVVRFFTSVFYTLSERQGLLSSSTTSTKSNSISNSAHNEAVTDAIGIIRGLEIRQYLYFIIEVLNEEIVCRTSGQASTMLASRYAETPIKYQSWNALNFRPAQKWLESRLINHLNGCQRNASRR